MVRLAAAAACTAAGSKRPAAVAVRGVKARLRVAARPLSKRSAAPRPEIIGSPARSAKARCRLRVHCVVSAPPPGALGAESKRALRGVLRLVHPDRYVAHPRAQEVNSASLQQLNAYVDLLSRGEGARCKTQALRFLVNDAGAVGAGALREVACVLPPGGSLSALFAAFAVPRRRSLGGLSPRRGGASPRTVSPRGGAAGSSRRASATRDAELLAWLSSHLGEATARRELYESRAAGLAAAKAALEAEFGLTSLHLGFTAESATAEPLHVAALAEALRCFSAEDAAALAGAHIVLCDAQEMPRTTASPPRAASSDGRFVLAENGTLWLSLCADWRPLWRFLRGADLAWAAAASAAAAKRSAEADAALPRLAALLRVKYIYAPATLRPEPLSGFCASLEDAGAVLAAAPPPAGVAAGADGGGAFGFGLHVCAEVTPGAWDVTWADAAGRALVAYAFGQKSVFVAADCPPFALATFLAQHGARCDAARAAGDAVRAALEQAQARLCAALGITLGVSVLLPDAVALAAAERLLAAAPQLRAAVGQQVVNARLMLVADADPCRYACLPNGTLCIPASARVEEVMRAILANKVAGAGAAAGTAAGAAAAR